MTPATVPALQRRVAELETKLAAKDEQLAYYKGEVRTQGNRAAEAQLMVAYRLPPLHARYAYLIYLQRGRPLSHQTALEALYRGEAEWPEPKVFAVLVHALRERMGSSSIQTVWTLGYCMSGAQIREIDALLNVKDPLPIYALKADDTMPPMKPRDWDVTWRSMKLFADGRPRTAQDVANALGWKSSRGYVQITHLRNNGLIVRAAVTGRPAQYVITNVGREWLAARTDDADV
jgi:hypothetical protein